MKKLLYVIVVGMFISLLAACGSSDDVESNKEKIQIIILRKALVIKPLKGYQLDSFHRESLMKLLQQQNH
ncbi:hypothetical protein [Ornithinibacillus sp. JPR2-1]|uniref:hypothetical protein n=1 Tax=Ornithinibacillus sp. JPR2-1 TaxID=2094019 RepID=UPI0031D86BD3